MPQEAAHEPTADPGVPEMVRWAFVDMNSFFASIEQHLRPELRGLPVGVIPVDSDRTGVIAANTMAKARGVRMGTSVRDALEACPDIRLIKARPDVYVEVHHAIIRSIETCAPIHKVYSIDEWAIELMGAERICANALDLGRRIKARLRTDFSEWLTCSIGIAPTRLLAKIASDLRKPDGLTVVTARDLPDRLEGMRVQDLCGIGAGMEARLAARGITTVRELWNLDRRQSIEAWGSIMGAHWWAGFHGIDEPEIPTRTSSMTHANVLEPRFRTDGGARGILVRLLSRLGVRLRRAGYVATSLAVGVRYTNGARFFRDTSMPHVQDTPTLLEFFRRVWDAPRPGGTPVQVEVMVGGLVLASQTPGSLFPEADRPARLSRAMDAINQRWGLEAVHFGAMHGFTHQMDNKIAFGRIPDRAAKGT